MAKQETPKKSSNAGKQEMTYVRDKNLDISPLKELAPPNIRTSVPNMVSVPDKIIQEYPISNKNQSSPGSTSGGFSYKLKKD